MDVLSNTIKDITGISSDVINNTILAYAVDSLVCALSHLRPQYYNVKDQLLLNYIRDPREHDPERGKDYRACNIEEQIQLSMALSYRKTRTGRLVLKNLYQFHRNQGDHEKVLDIIKTYFKLLVVKENEHFLCEAGKLANVLSDETLSVREDLLFLAERRSKKFMKHYLPAQVNGPDFADMDQIFETLLSASVDSKVYHRLIDQSRHVPDEP